MRVLRGGEGGVRPAASGHVGHLTAQATSRPRCAKTGARLLGVLMVDASRAARSADRYVRQQTDTAEIWAHRVGIGSRRHARPGLGCITACVGCAVHESLFVHRSECAHSTPASHRTASFAEAMRAG
ncbi:hypothetical protein THICB1_110231 [Thiomonas arsenitoxydans]|uniref:Uncharacterized protein n=1 Tax=Thiomonas arsenitoxydans (strain DSM 22701 / CIP 110005 / 3As) TaxID=426114 RepID=A0ABM9T1R8_THIA3|nr:hypothetical protein THICB1_110231 [Thiomonas arsenitoxydans]CQR32220.1 hypothetical protein ACO3_30140 [Thiomonas arsenitoxydans]